MRFLTAGESHGPQLTAVIEGVPSGFTISLEQINEDLAKRQGGYGRGRRMQIEKDQVKVLSGIRNGKTTGSPITLVIENKDFQHWTKIMSVEQGEEDKTRRVSRPRPGHADLNGGLKYQLKDLRDVLERSSARETAIRVAIGSLVKQLLTPFGIQIFSHVINIGGITSESYHQQLSTDQFIHNVDSSVVRCADINRTERMKEIIDEAKKLGDTVGGVVEVIVLGLPIGLGSYVQWDRKLDGKIGQAILSIQAFKGVEIGLGFEVANQFGSKVHDEIYWDRQNGYFRDSNHAGGIEGGMTNGMPLIVKGAMKPIPTLYKPLKSIDIDTKQPFEASIERSDACAVPAASIVAENVIAWEVAHSFFDKFSGDSLTEINLSYNNYLQLLKDY